MHQRVASGSRSAPVSGNVQCYVGSDGAPVVQIAKRAYDREPEVYYNIAWGLLGGEPLGITRDTWQFVHFSTDEPGS